MTKEIIADALLEFIQLVHSYCQNEGTFCGYIKNYLPCEMELFFRQIIKDLNSVYLDGMPEDLKEEFMLRYMSYVHPEKDEELQLDKYKFTEKQREVALLLSEGYNDTQVAKIFGISRQGVLKHKTGIRNKMIKFVESAS